MQTPVPIVEAADDAHAISRRCPDGERDAPHVAELAHVRAEFFVEAQVLARVEEIFVEVAERR